MNSGRRKRALYLPITLHSAMPRTRDTLVLGTLTPGPLNAVTDVGGVRVGHASLVGGSLQTGVTAVLPHGRLEFITTITVCASS